MKVAFFLLSAIFACVYGATLPELESGNGLAALLAAQGGMETIMEMQNARIVGGAPAQIQQFPWIVSMQRFGAHRCGASIVSTTRLVSVAHCTWLIAASTLQINAGSTMSQQQFHFIQVASFVNHPSYNPLTLNNDINVMTLATPLTFSAVAAPIGLPDQDASVATGAMALVAGWGALNEGGAASPGLQYVAVPIVSNADCNIAYSGGITAGMLCAGFPEGGRDACQGDSGGPLTIGGTLVGAVSWGQGCARPNFPGVYARVAFYRNWINLNL